MLILNFLRLPDLRAIDIAICSSSQFASLLTLMVKCQRLKNKIMTKILMITRTLTGRDAVLGRFNGCDK